MRPAYLEGFNPLRYVPDRFVAVAISAATFATAAWLLPTWLSVPVALAFTAVYVDYIFAAVGHHKGRYHGPWFERLIGWRISRWWWRFSTPVELQETFGVKKVWARPASPHSYDFFEVFDEAGNLLRTEQEINWSLGWSNRGSGLTNNPDIEIITTEPEEPYRLSWLARLRSRG